MFQAENCSLNLPSGTVDYIRFGSRAKTLIMLPGVGDGLKTVKGMALPFAFLYRKLAKEFTVYAFSRRRVLTPGLTTREMAEDLNSAMEALGLSAAALVGVSQGGMIAQWLAIDHPEKVDRSFEKGVANAMEILTRALQAEVGVIWLLDETGERLGAGPFEGDRLYRLRHLLPPRSRDGQGLLFLLCHRGQRSL